MYWKFNGERKSAMLLEWLSDLKQGLATPYPDHIPGIVEDFKNTLADIYENMKIAYIREPVKMTYFFVAIGGILLVFLLCFLYALFESCYASDEEAEEDAPKKPKTE